MPFVILHSFWRLSWKIGNISLSLSGLMQGFQEMETWTWRDESWISEHLVKIRSDFFSHLRSVHLNFTEWDVSCNTINSFPFSSRGPSDIIQSTILHRKQNFLLWFRVFHILSMLLNNLRLFWGINTTLHTPAHFKHLVSYYCLSIQNCLYRMWTFLIGKVQISLFSNFWQTFCFGHILTQKYSF